MKDDLSPTHQTLQEILPQAPRLRCFAALDHFQHSNTLKVHHEQDLDASTWDVRPNLEFFDYTPILAQQGHM